MLELQQKAHPLIHESRHKRWVLVFFTSIYNSRQPDQSLIIYYLVFSKLKKSNSKYICKKQRKTLFQVYSFYNKEKIKISTSKPTIRSSLEPHIHRRLILCGILKIILPKTFYHKVLWNARSVIALFALNKRNFLFATLETYTTMFTRENFCSVLGISSQLYRRIALSLAHHVGSSLVKLFLFVALCERAWKASLEFRTQQFTAFIFLQFIVLEELCRIVLRARDWMPSSGLFVIIVLEITEIMWFLFI